MELTKEQELRRMRQIAIENAPAQLERIFADKFQSMFHDVLLKTLKKEDEKDE